MEILKKLILVLFLFSIGCASTTQTDDRVPFLYDPPQVMGYKSGYVLALKEIEDKRRNVEPVENIYKNDPMEEMFQIIHNEVMSTGLFSQIVRIPRETQNEFTYASEKKARFLMYPTLIYMGWNMPGENNQNIEASIYGDMKIKIKIIDSANGKELLYKEYNGWCEDSTKKEICKLPMIKASMIGRSFKIIMNKLKADLDNMVNSGSWESAG